MANKRWIVTDMDDTMIKHYGKPSTKIVNLWNDLSGRVENFLVVATGQSHIKVIDKFLANNLALPDYIISNQGTVIYRPKCDEVMKVFCLTYDKVHSILSQFLRNGGEEKFIRICTLDKVIVFDCEESRSFYEKNPQSNIEFSADLWSIIKKNQYTKLVLSAPFRIVEQTLSCSEEIEGVTLLNSGETAYGRGDYYRLEIVASNKRIALEYLISYWSKSQKDFSGIHIICLGDEISDYGLAEVALNINDKANSTGHFAIINTSSNGNISLSQKVLQKAKEMSDEDCLIFAPSVECDGWESAIFEWQEKINKSGN